MKLFLSYVFCLFILNGFSQGGIGTIDPDPSSALDITASNKGILIPRVSLDNVTNTAIDGTNTVIEGLMIYNTNPTTIGGIGTGFYFFNGTSWEKLNGLIPGTSDADWYVENTSLPATAITDNIYTEGKVSIGTSETPNPLTIKTTTEKNLLKMEMVVPGDETQILMQGNMSSTSSGSQRAGVFQLSKNGTGTQNGLILVLDGDTSSLKTGISISVNGNGNERHRGITNSFNSGGNGPIRGVNNSFNGIGTGMRYGLANEFNAAVGGAAIGVRNDFFANNPSGQTGVETYLTNTGNGERVGIFNYINGNGSGYRFGIKNSIIGESNGEFNGEHTIIKGTGTGKKHGNYISIDNESNGDLYGLYVSVLRNSGVSFAGYFLGKVSIGTLDSNKYIFPSSRGTDGQIMQTDASGNVSWVDPSSLRPINTQSEINQLKSEIQVLKEMIILQQKNFEILQKQVNTQN